MLSLVKYIHLNPMRVGIVKEVDKYPWSSHRVYIEKAEGERLGVVDTEQVLGMFSENKGGRGGHIGSIWERGRRLEERRFMLQ